MGSLDALQLATEFVQLYSIDSQYGDIADCGRFAREQGLTNEFRAIRLAMSLWGQVEDDQAARRT